MINHHNEKKINYSEAGVLKTRRLMLVYGCSHLLISDCLRCFGAVGSQNPGEEDTQYLVK